VYWYLSSSGIRNLYAVRIGWGEKLVRPTS
jgi:hypothetical protein